MCPLTSGCVRVSLQTHPFTRKDTATYLIIVTGKIRDKTNVLRSDDFNASLKRHRDLLFDRLARTGPLGGVVVRQVTNPVGKTNLNVSVESCYWKVLEVCVGGGGGGGGGEISSIVCKVRCINYGNLERE